MDTHVKYAWLADKLYSFIKLLWTFNHRDYKVIYVGFIKIFSFVGFTHYVIKLSFIKLLDVLKYLV